MRLAYISYCVRKSILVLKTRRLSISRGVYVNFDYNARILISHAIFELSFRKSYGLCCDFICESFYTLFICIYSCLFMSFYTLFFIRYFLFIFICYLFVIIFACFLRIMFLHTLFLLIFDFCFFAFLIIFCTLLCTFSLFLRCHNRQRTLIFQQFTKSANGGT